MEIVQINGIFEVRDGCSVVAARFATTEEAEAYVANPPVVAVPLRPRPTPLKVKAQAPAAA